VIRANDNLYPLTIIYLFISNEYIVNQLFTDVISAFYKIIPLIRLPLSQWGSSTTGRDMQNKQFFAIEKGI
jgi:hypothetical protein